jgi:hypothetical protein
MVLWREAVHGTGSIHQCTPPPGRSIHGWKQSRSTVHTFFSLSTTLKAWNLSFS